MKISILTISYNSEKTIEKAIQSVLHQNYSDWEHIIVDGGSTDGTVDSIKKYPHIKWISELDKGQSDAMNKAFALSSGDVIGYLNSDDYYNPNIFGEVVSALKASEQTEIIVGRLKIYREGNTLYRDPINNYNNVARFWLHRFPANPVSYFYRRNVQLEVGEFPVDNHYTMDYWFMLRAFKNRSIIKTNTEFGVFDLHADTKTGSSNVEDNLKKEFLNYGTSLPLIERIIFLTPWYGTKLNYSKRNISTFIKQKRMGLSRRYDSFLKFISK